MRRIIVRQQRPHRLQRGRCAGLTLLVLALAGVLLVACGGNDASTSYTAGGATTASGRLAPVAPTTAARNDAPAQAAPVPGLAVAGATTAAGAVATRPATGATDSTGLSAPSGLSQTGDAKVIRNGSITLTVKDVAGTMDAVWNTATDLGGFVLTSSSRGAGDDLRGEITLRVPADRYKAALDRIRGYGIKVLNEESTAQDVGEEYVDLQARQKNLELTVAQLQGVLAQAKTVDETLRVQQQLNSVQGDLERVKGRLNYLDNRAAFSTITVSLQPVPVVKEPLPQTQGWSFGHSVADAWARSVHGLQIVADLLINLVIGGWWLILLAVLAFTAGRRVLRRYSVSVPGAGRALVTTPPPAAPTSDPAP